MNQRVQQYGAEEALEVVRQTYALVDGRRAQWEDLVVPDIVVQQST